MSDDFYYTKYLKYKAKYLNLIKQTGGEIKCTQKPTTFSNGKKNVSTCCSQGDLSLCQNRVVKPGETDAYAYDQLVIDTKKEMNPPPPARPASPPSPGVKRDGLRKR